MSETKDKVKQALMDTQLFSEYRRFIQEQFPQTMDERIKRYNLVLNEAVEKIDLIYKLGDKL